MNDDQTNEAGATALLDAFQRDLLDLVQQERYATMPHIVFVGLLELVGLMARNGARLEPSSIPTLLQHIEVLRQHVHTAGAEGPPAPTRH